MSFFFFNDTATTEIYTLSLHDALPISGGAGGRRSGLGARGVPGLPRRRWRLRARSARARAELLLRAATDRRVAELFRRGAPGAAAGGAGAVSRRPGRRGAP